MFKGDGSDRPEGKSYPANSGRTPPPPHDMGHPPQEKGQGNPCYRLRTVSHGFPPSGYSPPGGLRSRAEPRATWKRGTGMHRGILHLAPPSPSPIPPGPGGRRAGKVAMGCTTGIHHFALPSPAGSSRLLFILLSNQLSCRSRIKRGREGKEEEGVWSKTVATPLTSSHQSKELLLLEKCFLAG